MIHIVVSSCTIAVQQQFIKTLQP